MKSRKAVFLMLGIGISLLGATHRWGDSAHSIGLIKAGGGSVRHPTFLPSGAERYNLIATATVIPPCRGNARVVLEGRPEMDYEIFMSGPVVDLKLRRLPEFRDNTIYGLQPGDRIALWVLMRPPSVDPVCGMACEGSFVKCNHEGKEYCFCGEGCLEAFRKGPENYRGRDSAAGTYNLVLYEEKTGSSILNVPVIFQREGEENHADQH